MEKEQRTSVMYKVVTKLGINIIVSNVGTAYLIAEIMDGFVLISGGRV